MKKTEYKIVCRGDHKEEKDGTIIRTGWNGKKYEFCTKTVAGYPFYIGETRFAVRNNGGAWTIDELTSGYYIGAAKTRKAAIEKAVELVKNKGAEIIKSVMAIDSDANPEIIPETNILFV